MQGSLDKEVRVLTETIMREAERGLSERDAPSLTVSQYNAIYEAVQKVLEGNK
jgi:hypothetical protein